MAVPAGCAVTGAAMGLAATGLMTTGFIAGAGAVCAIAMVETLATIAASRLLLPTLIIVVTLSGRAMLTVTMPVAGLTQDEPPRPSAIVIPTRC